MLLDKPENEWISKHAAKKNILEEASIQPRPYGSSRIWVNSFQPLFLGRSNSYLYAASGEREGRACLALRAAAVLERLNVGCRAVEGEALT